MGESQNFSAEFRQNTILITGLHLYKGTGLTCFILLPFFYYENTVILICVKHNINKIHHLFEKQKQIFYALPKFS